MKLSQAIRLGAMLKPQGRGSMERSGRTCAYGAAYDAVGILDTAKRLRDEGDVEGGMALVNRAFPLIATLTHPCPVCGVNVWVAPGVIVTHLNDRHRWTREQIADWVESIEQQQEQIEHGTAMSVRQPV